MRLFFSMNRLWPIIAIAWVATAPAASAQSTEDLTQRINAWRSAPQACEGKRTAATGPLSPDRALERVRVNSGERLLDTLKAAGYQGASASVIEITGPRDGETVMKFVVDKYCRVIANAQFADIGIRRDGSAWQVVLARRLLSPDLGDWRAAGMDILKLTNAARAVARSCGSRRFPAAPPLAWNAPLAGAALAHSRDMATRNYFDHASPEGVDAGDRTSKAGYAWQRVGENIAAAQGSPEQAVSAWLSSPVHCEAVMDAAFREMGAAYAIDSRSDSTIYWTQVFGSARQ